MLHPDLFLKLVVHEVNDVGDDAGLCAGFQRGVWRNDEFADHVMEWLPEFALNYSQLQELGHHNAIKLTKKAAQTVYQTEKYGKRGEFGEILLHIALRQIYKTVPAVSKIYYKSSVNETVKGFDAVHVRKSDTGLELWIGETKFYDDVTQAIYDVSKEIVDHLETDYLRSEFILIDNKVDPNWPEAEELKKLLDKNVSLDEVFERACIPVLLTYDSEVVGKSKIQDASYLESIKIEMVDACARLRTSIAKKYEARYGVALPLTVHAILVPLHEKKKFIAALDSRLKAHQ